MVKLKFTKIRDVNSPSRAHPSDAGIDFYIPNDWNNKNEYLLSPHKRINIPSGIKVNVPRGYALIAHNKSGVASKFGLDRLAEVIDCEYQGEIHLNVVNTGDNIVMIHAGMKILQFVLLPVNLAMPIEVNEEELFIKSTIRGNNGFGSTGI